jgi:hypothetical protein
MELPVDDVTERDWQTAEDPGTVRVAMVGLGWWTRAKAVPAVEESAFCETTVLVSGSKEKAQDSTGLAESIEHGLTYEEFHDGAAAAAYDAVYICTPNAATSRSSKPRPPSGRTSSVRSRWRRRFREPGRSSRPPPTTTSR